MDRNWPTEVVLPISWPKTSNANSRKFHFRLLSFLPYHFSCPKWRARGLGTKSLYTNFSRGTRWQAPKLRFMSLSGLKMATVMATGCDLRIPQVQRPTAPSKKNKIENRGLSASWGVFKLSKKHFPTFVAFYLAEKSGTGWRVKISDVLGPCGQTKKKFDPKFSTDIMLKYPLNNQIIKSGEILK